MSIDRRLLLTMLGMALLFGVGAGVLAIPQYRAAREARATIASVRQRLASGKESAAGLSELRERLEAEQLAFGNASRTIPSTADTASLMRELNRPIDGVNVLDQTFNAGRTPTPLPRVEDGSLSSLPLTIDMVATFAVVHDVIRNVERMPRLVRVASVRVERLAETDGLVKATILLDVIFESGAVAP